MSDRKYSSDIYKLLHAGTNSASGSAAPQSSSASASASSSNASATAKALFGNTSGGTSELNSNPFGEPPQSSSSVDSEAVTSDVSKMVARHQGMINQARQVGHRQHTIQRQAEAPKPKPVKPKAPKRRQIPGLNVSPLHKLIRWDVDAGHYVRQTHMEPITRGKQIVRHKVLAYKTVQVRIPQPLLIELRDHYLHSTTLSMDQAQHFTNQDLIVLSVLPAFGSDVQDALVDALSKPDGVMKKIYNAQVNQVNSLSNRKLLISINDKLDQTQNQIKRSRSTQHGFFKRLETVIYAIYRLLAYLFAGEFNQKVDFQNSQHIIQAGSLKDKVKAYMTALESDYVGPALRAAFHVGSEEQKREATVQQTNRQSKHRQ